MKNLKKILNITIVFIIAIILQTNISRATLEKNLVAIPYSDEYQEWLELPEKQKTNTIVPLAYEITPATPNVSSVNSRLGSSSIESEYDLRNEIESIPVRNQTSTNTCWSFASNTSLETNLKKMKSQTYTFSARYLEYATSRTFLNNEINPRGYYREIDWRREFIYSF